VKAFFAKKEPETKPTYNEKDKKWAIDMLTIEAQYKRSLPSDYNHVGVLDTGVSRSTCSWAPSSVHL
jgi:hypothetical protein